MASQKLRRECNASGPVFVDSTCIDCDACRALAPDLFDEVDEQSRVHAQPDSPEQFAQAALALVACPTGSIGMTEEGAAVREAAAAFPVPVAEDVFYCGYHSEKSFGAASYLIRRPEGNILVDSPRYAEQLVKRIEALGGLRYVYLTHRDDVADYARYARRFGAESVMHVDDARRLDIDLPLKGYEVFELAKDVRIIPVPGHTKGHTVLLYRDKFLFTGDHLAYSPRRGHLIGFRDHCWHSWPETIRSMERLEAYSFEWILPGHGRRFHAPADEMPEHMKKCIAWMKS